MHVMYVYMLRMLSMYDSLYFVCVCCLCVSGRYVFCVCMYVVYVCYICKLYMTVMYVVYALCLYVTKMLCLNSMYVSYICIFVCTFLYIWTYGLARRPACRCVMCVCMFVRYVCVCGM